VLLIPLNFGFFVHESFDISSIELPGSHLAAPELKNKFLRFASLFVVQPFSWRGPVAPDLDMLHSSKQTKLMGCD